MISRPAKVQVGPRTDWDLYGRDSEENRAFLAGFALVDAPDMEYQGDLLADTYKHSVRACGGDRGSAGASPSQERFATSIGRARLRPSLRRRSRLSGSFALPRTLRHVNREGEAPSEPAEAIAAQRELRRPKNASPRQSGGRGSVRACGGDRGSAGARPPKNASPRQSGGRGSVRACGGPLDQARRLTRTLTSFFPDGNDPLNFV